MLVSSNVASRVLKPAARRTDVGWASFHTLRHTCASTLFRHGVNIKQVQLWLGHHSAAFTLDTYVHLLPDDLPESPFDVQEPEEPLEPEIGKAEAFVLIPEPSEEGGDGGMRVDRFRRSRLTVGWGYA